MKALVVDDDRDFRDLVKFMLVEAGHEVRVATDGFGALEAHREDRADLIVIDIFMPRCDGLETIRQLREEDSEVPLICVSAGSKIRGDVDYTEAALRFGAQERLLKPFTADELLAAIERVSRVES